MKTELEGGTKEFSVRIVRLIRAFPKTVDGIEMGRQLLRSGTSIGANYREANRAESKPGFIHKVGVSEKEASETTCLLEICANAPLGEVVGVRLASVAVALMVLLATVFAFPLSRFPLFAFH